MFNCIFDFDGTIVDSMFIWEELPERYLKKNNATAKANINEVVATLSVKECCELFISDYGIKKSVEQIQSELNEMIKSAYFYEISAKKYMIDFIKTLKSYGVKMCIATATDSFLVEECLKRLQIQECFEFIATCSQLNTSKTEPLIYEWCVNKIGGRIDNCIVFEDVIHAIEVCADMGLKTVAVLDAGNHETFDRIAQRSDYAIRTKKDFQKMLKVIIEE